MICSPLAHSISTREDSRADGQGTRRHLSGCVQDWVCLVLLTGDGGGTDLASLTLLFM